MPNVGYTRDEVGKLIPTWNLIRDCLSGQSAVKAAGTRYLPKPNPTDVSEENSKRYEHYLQRAVYYNVTQRTLAGLVGQVFKQDPIVELPTLMEPLIVDIDGAGVSLAQQCKKALGLALAYGRAALLADYPNTAEPASRLDLLEGNIRPTITLFDPWHVINWRTKTVGARNILSLVVISERYVMEDDGFEIKFGDQWRVLRLEDDTGFYRVEIWRDDQGMRREVERYYPRDATGNNLTEIPFTFIGPVNNDPHPDQPPLYDLAVLNIAHYRNSADYEESCFLVGQPTLYLSGLTKDWVEDTLGGKIHLGSRAAIPLPTGGAAGLLQANPNILPREAMEHKERQMVALGAKLVEQRAVQRTLGEAQLEQTTETSVLATTANNVVDAYRKALAWAAGFIGNIGEIHFDISTDFDIGRMTPQERAQLIAEWQAGAITFEEMRFSLTKADVAFLPDEEAKAQLEEEMQFGAPMFPNESGNND